MKQMFDFSKVTLKAESGRGLKWEYIPTKTHNGDPVFNLKLEIPIEKAIKLTEIRADEDGRNINYLSHWRLNGIQFSATEEGEFDLGNAYNNADRGAYGFEETLEKSIELYLRKLSANRYASTMSTIPTQLLATICICSAGASCRSLHEMFQSALSSMGNSLLELIIVGFAYDVYYTSNGFGANDGFEKLWRELPEDVQKAFPLKKD